jgi:hypothetical protein
MVGCTASHHMHTHQSSQLPAMLRCCLLQVVSNHIAQLRPYLACSKAYSIRGALMAATGSVLLKVRPA